MIVSRGEIWLVNLNLIKKNNEMGKVRPALVFQNNELNHNSYPTTIIMPISSDLVDDAEPLRFRVTKREKLKENSDIVITQIRAIDNSRFIEKIANLSEDELEHIKKLFDEITQ
ncbi:type II toxin-antitoxin system PemK/MazF family toxin [Aliarcobacter cryaerophilus]|uniref:type II toxin-antitoxin system PemK/MazF family toxin n=1 Tax=Aliarcobacter cryaerophilus TaxID=28198 RepID=UPI0021B5CA39|nr:type II toxin-antitoxin system PemK/MazF family toxin [Aliarcobacter cryaerophilus]MCT7493786.1 type II toxin-antitoxin system PemK/MazF family toxin [Aliarcobacter cryaerophilus]